MRRNLSLGNLSFVAEKSRRAVGVEIHVELDRGGVLTHNILGIRLFKKAIFFHELKNQTERIHFILGPI